MTQEIIKNQKYELINTFGRIINYVPENHNKLRKYCLDNDIKYTVKRNYTCDTSVFITKVIFDNKKHAEDFCDKYFSKSN